MTSIPSGGGTRNNGGSSFTNPIGTNLTTSGGGSGTSRPVDAPPATYPTIPSTAGSGGGGASCGGGGAGMGQDGVIVIQYLT
jgi:hypothetical protein